jgi:hypothetical protein
LDDDDANNSPLRAALIDKTFHQVDMLIRTIEAEDLTELPNALQSMALEDHHTLITILNMLRAYRGFLKNDTHADIRERLAVVFRPMDAWVHGQYSVTTPALLTIQAILYSHCEWFREELFESYSSLRSFEELTIIGFPERDRYFIAAIIAHQTLLRTAWTTNPEEDPREVRVFFKHKQGQYKFAQETDQDAVLGIALRRTLFEFIEGCNPERRKDDGERSMLRRQLASALILHCLCLQCRHSRFAYKNISFEIKKQALGFMGHLLAAERERSFPHAALAFVHYGRYVYQAQRQAGRRNNENLFSKSIGWIERNILDKQADPTPDAPLHNISFCFQRVASKKAWLHVKDIDDLEPRQEQRGASMPEKPRPRDIVWHKEDSSDDIIVKLLRKTVGQKYYKLNLDKKHYLLWMLGLDDIEGTEKTKLVDMINEWLEEQSQ